MSFHSFNGMMDWFAKREAANMTTDVLTDGGRGNGKSNVTLLELYVLEPRLDFRVNYVYDKDDLLMASRQWEGMDNVRTCFDEAKNLVYRRNALTNVNKSISILQTQIREKRGTRFWNTPDIEELEGFLTKDQCDVCQTVPGRGKLQVWRFWKNYHAPPNKREGRWVKAFDRDHIPNVEARIPWLGVEYRAWKSDRFKRVQQALNAKMSGVKPKRQTKKAMVVRTIQQYPEKTSSAIARLAGVSQPYVSKLRLALNSN